MVFSNPQKCCLNNDYDNIPALFERLDFNKDGQICLSDLISMQEKLHGFQNKSFSKVAESFLLRCGVDPNGTIDLPKFVKFVEEHDKKLAVIFDQMDEDKDGRICLSDVLCASRKLDMPLNELEAKHMLNRIDHEGNLSFDYRAWREYLILDPAHDISNIFTHWRHDILIDVGLDTATAIPEDYSLSEKSSGRQLLQLTAGAIAGAVSRTCTAPIDRLKLMRQVHGYKHKSSDFVQAYRYMLQEGGLLSLWRGNGVNVLKIAPETALKYGSYEHYKRLLSSGIENHWIPDVFQSTPLLTKFIAGSLAGSTAQTIIYPMEVLKTRMCLRKTGQFRSLWHCAKNVYKESGLIAFYRGYFVNLLGIIPYAGIELALYERCKLAYITHFMQRKSSDDGTGIQNPYNQQPPTYVIPLLAAFASACGIIATYPAGLVRAKLQASYYSQSTHTKTTARGLLQRILKDDGWRGLYRGMGVNLIKVLPAVGISLATYETLRGKFNLGPLGSG